MTSRNAHVGRTLHETVNPATDLLNGEGNDVDEYNDSTGSANGTAYLNTSLRHVDNVQLEINTNDAGLSSSAVGVQVVEARPAVPGDFASASDFVPGTVYFRIADEDGSGEISNDTDISSLSFNLVAEGE